MGWLNLAGSVAVLAAGLVVAGPGVAQPRFGGPHRGGSPDRFIEEHADRLDLDDETRAAIEKIVDESRARAEELHVELRRLHRGMHDLLSQETPDEAAVIEQAEAIGKTETELHKHRLGSLIKIRALLTPEQRVELTRIREESRHRWLEPLIESCEADVESFCSDAGDRWSRRQCLRDHWDDLSADCRDAVEAAKGKARDGLRRGQGRRGMGDF